MAIKLHWYRKDAENERVPEEEQWVKLANRCLTNDRNPSQDERKRCEAPHSLPEPAFYKMFTYFHDRKGLWYAVMIAGAILTLPAIHRVPSAGIEPTSTP